MGRRPVCLACLLLMLLMCLADGLGLPLIRGNPLPESLQAWIRQHPEAAICGEVERCAETETSQSVYLKETYLIYKSEKISIENVRVFLKTKKKVPAGTLLLVSGKLEEVGESRNPGEFDSRQYYACRHIYYFMKKAVIKKQSSSYSGYGQFLLDMQERFGNILAQAAGEDAPVFSAAVLGDKSSLELETKMRYQMAGIIHMLAISGLHISVLGMGLYQLLKRLGLGIWPSGLLALMVMLQYGMMTGGSVSTMRAVCMFLLSVGAKILGRIYDMMTALAVAAILILAESPAYLYSSSFLLSFGAVLGLGAAAPAFRKLAKGPAAETLLPSLAVQLTTLPVLLAFYGEVSVAGIFLNLIVLPTVGVVLASGVAAALLGLFWLPAAAGAALPGRFFLHVYEWLCGICAQLPFCTWVGGVPRLWQGIVYYALLAGAAYAASREKGVPERYAGKRSGAGGADVGKRSGAGGANAGKETGAGGADAGEKSGARGADAGKRSGAGRRGRLRAGWAHRWLRPGVTVLLLGVGIAVLGYHPGGKLKITCLDVGQGDGIVLETPLGAHFLIDGGSSSKTAVGQYQLLPYLKSQGISYLDAIFISHTDADHISGVEELLDFMGKKLTSIRAGTLILPGWSQIPEAYQKLEELAQKAGVKVIRGNEGKVFRSGDVRIRLLSPGETSTGADVNEEGMVMEVEYEEFQALFTGDIGEETEKKLLEKGCLEDIDFLKVGHHGSRHSSCTAFLEKLRPELSVISCSETNTYGHPSREAIERLEAVGSQVEYTMKSGAVTVISDGERVSVERFCEEDGIPAS